jgi:hypothetical protein
VRAKFIISKDGKSILKLMTTMCYKKLNFIVKFTFTFYDKRDPILAWIEINTGVKKGSTSWPNWLSIDLDWISS